MAAPFYFSNTDLMCLFFNLPGIGVFKLIIHKETYEIRKLNPEELFKNIKKLNVTQQRKYDHLKEKCKVYFNL